MKMQDELGTLYHDEMFVDVFSGAGQPTLARFPIDTGNHYAIRIGEKAKGTIAEA